MQRFRSRRLRTRCVAAALVAAAAPLAAAQTVLVVDDDGGPGVDFADLQAAADAAPDGAILLVRDGTYADGLSIAGRSLTILADAATPPVIAGGVEVIGLARHDTFTLRGFAVRGTGATLQVIAALGVVRLEDLDLTSFEEQTPGVPQAPQSVRVQGSDQVRLARVAVGVGVQAPAPSVPVEWTPLPALDVVQSTVAAYHCDLRGASGRAAGVDPLTLLPVPAQEGAPAARLVGATLRLDGCELLGGAGGAATYATAAGCVAPADGGDGVFAAGFQNSLLLLATGLAGGAAGAVQPDVFGVECPATADAGHAVGQAPGATLGASSTPAPRTRLDVAPVLPEDEGVVLDAAGPVGQLVLWGVALSPGQGPLTPFPSNVLEVGPGVIVFPLGATGALGQTSLSLPPLGDVLPPGTGLVVYHQVAGVAFDGTLFTGEPAVSALVDGGF